jgi:DUF4097 and DUF4098 domain-containing protein YvlB
MNMRVALTSVMAASLVGLSAPGVSAQSLKTARQFYQGRNRGPEQSDTLSRKIRVGRDGRISLSNISGTITVTTASGDEMSIDAVKHGRGDRRDLDRARVVIDERPGRVEIRTEYDRAFFRNDDVSVDYTVVVPAGVSLDVSSVSGRIRVDGVKGPMHVNSVSGSITSSSTPKLEAVRTVSGDVEVSGISHDGTLSISSVSGNLDITGLKARSVDINTVSGEIHLRDAACERLAARGLSGNFEYAGTLAKNGRYEVNSHSGNVRFTLADNTGFELNASSFSGSVRSDYQMTAGGERNTDIRRGRGPGRGPRNESMQATFGDGSASLNLHTFSGSITIAKK